MKALQWSLGFFAVLLGLCIVLFLGGLCSAWLEVRKERKAGMEPTRPGWESREKWRAVGGPRERLKVVWRTALSRARRGPAICWCGLGPIAVFPGWYTDEPDAYGCTAWEAGHPEAVRRHDAAGGYARVPVAGTPDPVVGLIGVPGPQRPTDDGETDG